jgi:ABC-type glycerol-3-phosphate transport system substrate-binding protein
MAFPAASPLTRRGLLAGAVTALGASGLLAACGGAAAISTSNAAGSAAATAAVATTSVASAAAATTVAQTASSSATTAAPTTVTRAATTSSAAVQAAPGAPSGAKTTLVFEWPQYTQEKTDYGNYIIDTYQKLHPNVTLQPMFNTNPTAKLTVTIAGGTPPDVGWFGAGWAAFLQAFLPLDTFVQQNKIDPKNYFTKLWQSSHWRNKQYVMPNGFTTTLLYYNKDIAKNAGVAPLTAKSTWSDLISAATKMQKPQSNVYGVALDMGSYYAELYYGGPLWNAAATTAAVNNAARVDMLELYKNLGTQYNLLPPADVIKADGGSSQKSFLQGHLAFFAGGAWNLAPSRAANFDWDITLLPVRNVAGQDYQATGMWTEEFFIEKDTKHQPEAWQFLQWVTGPELVSWAAKNGHIVPGRTDIANSPTFLQAFPKPANIGAFFQAADLSVPHDVHPEAPKLDKAIGDAVGLFLANPQTATATEALKQANDQVQVILDAYDSANKS